GEARSGVLRGEARDRQRLRDGVAQRGIGEVGAARVPAPLAEVDGDRDALVAVVRDRLDLALAHRDALPDALRDFGFGGGGAALARDVEHLRRDALELGGRDRQAAGRRRGGGAGGGCGRGGHRRRLKRLAARVAAASRAGGGIAGGNRRLS